MLDPIGLLAVARLLLAASTQQPPSQEQLRRAVSTAYYALFHKVMRAAAERFMGKGQEHSGGYAILYRSFDHTHVKRMCEELQLSTLRARIKVALRREAISQDARDFAESFPALQDARHTADYDPTALLHPSNVSSLLDAATIAMEAFGRIAPDEQTDILALLMARTRH